MLPLRADVKEPKKSPCDRAHLLQNVAQGPTIHVFQDNGNLHAAGVALCQPWCAANASHAICYPT